MRTLLNVLNNLRRISPGAANVALTAAVRRIIPLAATMGIRVEEVTDARTRMSMPKRRRVKNHMGDIYIGAEMTVMELTMALMLLQRFPLGEYGMLVKRVETDFQARAKGDVRAECEPPPELIATLQRDLQEKGSKAEGWMPVKLLAEDGSVICEARFLAALKKF